MTQTLRFQNHNVFGLGDPVTVEDVFKFYGSQAGIQTFSFDSFVQTPLHITDAPWENTFSTPTWVSTNGTDAITLSGSADGLYSYAVQTGPSYLAKFQVSWGSEFGIVVGQGSGTDTFIFHYKYDGSYRLFQTGTNKTYWQTGERGGPNSIADGVTPGATDFWVGVRYVRFSDDSLDAYYFVRIWRNGCVIASVPIPAGDMAVNYFGWAYTFTPGMGNPDLVIKNVRIPELTDYLDWASLDPGEAPTTGLQRAIEGRNLKYFIRWDGSMRAFRPKPAAVATTIHKENLENFKRTVDNRQGKSHIRMVGAYTQAEYLDNEGGDGHLGSVGSVRDPILNYTDRGMAMFDHRFDIVNNPYLETPYECLREAYNTVQTLKQAAVTAQVTISGNPLIEREDVLAVESLVDPRLPSATVDVPAGMANTYFVDTFSGQATDKFLATTYQLRGYYPLVP